MKLKDPNRKKHTNLPPLIPKGERSEAEFCDIVYLASPVPSSKRYELTEGGWETQPDFDAPQQGTVPFDLLYDGLHYWTPTPSGDWRSCNAEQAKRTIINSYRVYRGRQDAELNELEKVLQFVEAHCRVSAAYPVSGYSTGIYCMSPGQLVLVPEGFHLIEPGAGNCDHILTLLQGMFGKGSAQLAAVLAMWRQWYIDLRDRVFSPGQAQIFIGGRNSGKTFIQQFIITPLLGGRSTDPYPFLSGETRFNDDICGSEHLLCSDAGSQDAHTQRIIANKLKAQLFNKSHRIEGKRAWPINVSGYTRLTISCNTDPEDLKMLPLSTDSTTDKIATLWVESPGCFPHYKQRQRYLETVTAELPAFITYLLNYEVPKELSDAPEAQRCGVNTYHSEQADEIMNSLAPEEYFWEVLIAVFTAPRFIKTNLACPYAGSPTEIYEQMLRLNLDLTRAATPYPKTAGTYLTRLAKKNDGRVRKKTNHQKQTIYEVIWK